MGRLLPALCILFGYPVGVRLSLPLKLYSILVVTAYSSPYVYFRFIRNLLFPASSTLSFDRIALLGRINGVEMTLVIFANYFHLFALIFHQKTYDGLFQHGKVFNFESKTNKFLMLFSFSDLALVFFVGETTPNVVRFISYAMIMFLSHLKVFQYCAILRCNSKDISFLIQLIQPNENLIYDLLIRYHQIVSEIHKSNSKFGVQILIAFASLVVDILYITGFILVLKSLSKITLMYFLYLFHHVVVRIVLFIYLSHLVTRAKRLGIKFHTKLFGTIRTRSRLFCNNTVSTSLHMNWPINLNACGFFEYGCPLVASIFASIATYLVIILEFSVLK